MNFWSDFENLCEIFCFLPLWWNHFDKFANSFGQLKEKISVKTEGNFLFENLKRKTKREIIFVPFPCLWNLLWYLSTLKYGALEGSRKKNYAREFIKWKVVFLKINSSLSSLAMKVLFYLPHLLMSCGQKEGPRSKVFCRIFLTVDHQFVFQRKSLWNILFFWSIPLSFSLSFFPTNSSQSLYIGNILSKKLLIINAITQ